MFLFVIFHSLSMSHFSMQMLNDACFVCLVVFFLLFFPSLFLHGAICCQEHVLCLHLETPVSSLRTVCLSSEDMEILNYCRSTSELCSIFAVFRAAGSLNVTVGLKI